MPMAGHTKGELRELHWESDFGVPGLLLPLLQCLMQRLDCMFMSGPRASTSVSLIALALLSFVQHPSQPCIIGELAFCGHLLPQACLAGVRGRPTYDQGVCIFDCV